MTSDENSLMWKRGEIKNLSLYFSTSEFTCHCGNCTDQTISKDLISRLQNLRSDFNAEVKITSGYRCAAYQASLAAKGLETAKGISQHTLGNAADIAATDMTFLRSLCDKYFNAIGTARSFLHVDTRGPHSDGTKRLWSYTK